MVEYTLLETVLTGLFVAASSLAAYIMYRKKELIDLSMEIIESYEDNNISEEEYGKIVQKLKDVVYKK